MRRVPRTRRTSELTILISLAVVFSALSFLFGTVKAQPGVWSDTFSDQTKISTMVNTEVAGGFAQIQSLAADYSWQKQGVVLPHGTGGDPDSNYATYPWILKDSNGIFRMWYTGVSASDAYSIQYATSWDGYDWLKHGTVIPYGFSGTGYDSARVYSCAVLYEGGMFKMWYTGQTPGDVRRILYATSPDGQTWTYDSLALDVGGTGESRAVAFPSVINDSGTYKMWYSAIDTGGNWEIFHATSPDGLIWTKQGRVMPLGLPGALDDTSIAKNVVTKNSTGDYRMWYGGAGVDINILYAESPDGIDWSDRKGISIGLGLPGEPDEDRVSLGNVLLPVNNVGWMWYAGYDISPDAKVMIATMGSLGNLTSVEIMKSAGYDWEALFFNKTTIPDETEVLISVLNANTLRPYPGYSDLTAGPVDLSSIPKTDNSIRLRADFYGTTTENAFLDDWAVTWNDIGGPIFGGLVSAVDDGTDGSVTLNWNPATDPTPPITYNIYIAPVSMGQNFFAPNYTTSLTTYQVTGLVNGVRYYFIVRAEDGLGWEDSNTVERSAIPTTPVDSTPPIFAGLIDGFDAGTGGTVTLQWNPADDPDTAECNSDPSLPITYNVYHSTTPGGQDFMNPNATTQNTIFDVTGLTNGITYYFVVRAEDSAGNEESNVVELSIMPTTPVDSTPPTFTGLGTATDLGTGGTINLAWSGANDPDTQECNSDPSVPITYNIYYSKVSGAQDFMNPNATTTNTFIDITGLENGVFHYFVVRAEDSAGNEETNLIQKSAIPTTPVDDTPPSFAGLQFAIDAGTGGTVSLNWLTATDPDTVHSNSDPSLPINYDIFISVTSGGQNFLSPNATTTSLSIDATGLKNGVSYYFVVRARDAAGNQETNTEERTAIPTTPTDDTAPIFPGLDTAVDSQTGGNVTLTWSTATDPDTVHCNSDPSVPITYYIYASVTPGGQNFMSPNATTQNTNIEITGLKNGITYYFVVRARDSVGNQETNTVERSAMPTTPVDDEAPVFAGIVLASDAETGGAVDLYWAAATDPDLIECNSDPSLPITYNIYYSTTSGGQSFAIPDATTQDTEIQITGLQDGVTYYFVVRAQDSAGNSETNVVERSAMPTTPVDTTPPEFLGLLSATDLGSNGNVSLTWSSANDPDTIECNSDPSLPIQYNIYVSTSSGGHDFLTPNQTVSGTQATVTGLENGVTYYFVVRAVDAAGNEEDNTVERSTMPTTPVDSTPPTFQGLSTVVVDNGTGDITLMWNAATDPDDPKCNADPSTPITYNIYISEVPGVFDFNLPSATTSQQQYPLLDLERGVTYYFIVRAEDNAGNEETNTVTKSAELKVLKDEFDFMDYWWLILIIIIILLLVVIVALLAKRKKKEEPEAEEEEEPRMETEEETEE